MGLVGVTVQLSTLSWYCTQWLCTSLLYLNCKTYCEIRMNWNVTVHTQILSMVIGLKFWWENMNKSLSIFFTVKILKILCRMLYISRYVCMWLYSVTCFYFTWKTNNLHFEIVLQSCWPKPCNNIHHHLQLGMVRILVVSFTNI